MLSSEELRRWRALLQETFQCKHVKRWREIIVDLLCVDIGLKPALLWDYTSTTKQKMTILLKKAKEKWLLKNSLAVISVEMDLIILNEESSRGDNSLLELNMLKAVDVSSDLQNPKVIKEFLKLQSTYTVCEVILKYRNDVSLKQSTFNPTSLFGLLLGYPIVYWYEMNETGGNCLSYQPLRVYKVRGCLGKTESSGSTSHVVFSFSVPECVTDEFPGCVADWFEKIVEKNNWKMLFCNVDLEEKTVTLPNVCL